MSAQAEDEEESAAPEEPAGRPLGDWIWISLPFLVFFVIAGDGAERAYCSSDHGFFWICGVLFVGRLAVAGWRREPTQGFLLFYSPLILSSCVWFSWLFQSLWWLKCWLGIPRYLSLYDLLL